MGVVASATTRFSWVRKRFLSGMWPWRNSHPGGGSLSWTFKLRGPLCALCAERRSAPVSCVASFATNAECSPRWCLSSGGLLSLCPPLCRSWLLSFFSRDCFSGTCVVFISSPATPRVSSSPRQWRATLRLKLASVGPFLSGMWPWRCSLAGVGLLSWACLSSGVPPSHTA